MEIREASRITKAERESLIMQGYTIHYYKKNGEDMVLIIAPSWKWSARA